MKVSFQRDLMLSSFQSVASVVPTRTPKPILRNVLLSVDGNSTLLFATDTEIAVRMELQDVQVDAPGEILLPVDRFGPILRESSDERMTVETDGQQILVHGQRSEFQLPACNPDEYPRVQALTCDSHYEITAHALVQMIRRTSFATDSESSRYALGGVLFEFEDDKLYAIATDARRLAKMEVPAKTVGSEGRRPDQIIVPSRALQLMERLIGEQEEPVQLAIRENDLLMQLPSVQMSARLLEGRFPNWRDVVGKGPTEMQVELSVGPLGAAVRQAAVVTEKDSRSVELLFREGMLELSCATAEVGTSRIEMPISYHGDELPVPLDSKFLSEFLRVLELEKTVTFSTSGVDRPAEFRTDDGYLYVIMPMERRRKPKVEQQAAATAHV